MNSTPASSRCSMTFTSVPIGLTGLPLHSWPEVIAFLDELAIPYRWSTRFIFLDPAEAEHALRIQRRNWFQKRHGLGGMIKQVFSNGAAQSFENKDALAMAEDADDALAEASSNRVRFGYYTSAIILMDETRFAAESNAREIAKQLHHHGFPAVIEHVNANEAYLGSLPGHGYRNVRRPLIHTRNLADLMPTTNVWPGEEINPCPFYPENSPPLCYAATTGGTPFRLNLHVGDVGHTLIFGPTGSGKSTLLGILIAQFFRYPDAQVFCFDKGLSAFVLTKAAGGDHYDLGESEISFCPLASVNDDNERMWAQDWLETLLNLQGVTLLPQHRKAIWRALQLLGDSRSDARTITDLVRLLQDQTLRDGLDFYSLHGPMGRFLDADSERAERQPLSNLRDRSADGDGREGPAAGPHVSIPPDRPAAGRKTNAHRAGRSMGDAGQRRVWREDRRLAANAAQEERGRRALHPEPG